LFYFYQRYTQFVIISIYNVFLVWIGTSIPRAKCIIGGKESSPTFSPSCFNLVSVLKHLNAATFNCSSTRIEQCSINKHDVSVHWSILSFLLNLSADNNFVSTCLLENIINYLWYWPKTSFVFDGVNVRRFALNPAPVVRCNLSDVLADLAILMHDKTQSKTV